MGFGVKQHIMVILEFGTAINYAEAFPMILKTPKRKENTDERFSNWRCWFYR